MFLSTAGLFSLLTWRWSCVCTLSDLSHSLCGKLFSILKNEGWKTQCRGAEVTKLRTRGCHLVWQRTEPVDRFKVLSNQGSTSPHLIQLSNGCMNRVIFSACRPCLGLWSDLTVWCLEELQAWPRSVGNQQCAGVDCSVQNYRGGRRGSGCDFPEMESVQVCD